MKKFLSITLLMAVLFAFFVAATTRIENGETNISAPSNMWGSNLHTRSTSASGDTLADDAVNIYGPYSLCRKGGGPAASYLCVKGDAITGTTPEMDMYFQLITGTAITDTVSSWTSLCGLSATAQDTCYDISGLSGKAVVFKIENTDDGNTACQIPGILQFQLKDATTEYIKLK